MRMIALAIVAAILSITGIASAQTIQRVSFSPEFQTALDRDIGVREGEYLSEMLTRYVDAALARRGVAADAARIELSIVDARPNRPTFEQASDRPGLDTFNSISIGGAELHAVIRDSSGTATEVSHRFYSHDIVEASRGVGTWWDAQRAMRRFADKVADAYVAAN